MSKQKPPKQVNLVSSKPKIQTLDEKPKRDGLFLLPLVVTFFAFIPTFDNSFVNWDDLDYITNNRWIQALSFENIKGIFTTGIIGNYNPLPVLTFAIEKALFGADNLSAVIHANNLFLHMLCVFLVYRLSMAMGLQRWSSVFVALLFGIHPMRVESVAWATERKDVLFAAFYFTALLSYIKYLKSETYTFTNKHFLACFGFFILSLFSKVQAVSLPLSLLVLDYYFHRSFSVKSLLEKTPFFLGSLGMGIANIYTLKAAKSFETAASVSFSIAERLVVACHSFTIYVVKCIFPWEMLPIYPYPPTLPAYFYMTAFLFIASIAGVWLAYRKGWVNIVFAWLFFFVNFIFVSQIVGAGQGFLADRFTYVGYFGFFFLAVKLSENLSVKNSNYIKYGGVTYLLLCAFMTWNQVKVWKDGETLWTHQLENIPNAVGGWQNRGVWFRDNKQPQQALSDFNTALKINQKDATLYNSRGKTLAEMGSYEAAAQDFSRALSLKPNFLEALGNRGAAYGALNKIDSLLLDLTAVLAIDPLNADALLNRGMALDLQGKVDESIKDFTKVIELDPLSTNAFLNRMQGYRKLNQLDKALEDCNSYLALKKDNPDLWVDRALLKSRMGRCAEAISDFDQALAMDGSKGAVFAERARCHFNTGNVPLGKADAQKAVQLGAQNFVDPKWLK